MPRYFMQMYTDGQSERHDQDTTRFSRVLKALINASYCRLITDLSRWLQHNHECNPYLSAQNVSKKFGAEYFMTLLFVASVTAEQKIYI
jgi:hypothetical protein